MSKNNSDLTELGTFLRKLRIDCEIPLKVMSEKLFYTSSYLSLIEHGKRKVPKNFYDIFIKAFTLTKKQKEELNQLIFLSDKMVLGNYYVKTKKDVELMTIYMYNNSLYSRDGKRIFVIPENVIQPSQSLCAFNYQFIIADALHNEYKKRR